jgi:Tfp pilus assembly protein PilF
MQHCINYSMRAKYSLIILILLLPGHLTAAECNPVATLISLEGAVETKRADEDSWYETTLKQEFCAGDTLRTGDDSRAAVRLTNETLLRLDGNSALTFSHIKKKSRSILDLLRGAVHFISRTPKSLEVRTPYVNASIEGTEFVVQIQENGTDVTVYEGVVVATNSAGSIDITANQAAHAANNKAPVHIINASPLDAVTWALYYPPLPEQPKAADTLAQQTVSAIAQNRLVEAAELAKQSLQKNSQSAAAYMAQSYVDQAQFNIPGALANSQKAAELAPQNALTQARLAEVWLMMGDTQAAQQAAKQAVSIDPKLALAHTVLGFASLREINLDRASAAFEQAITLDSAAPLPRLGLGLVKIRQGALQSGREEIETAVLLDPANALLRSYMGKSYYEEKRNGLATDQFEMAKALDPNDPTAWFYDSILLQSDNRPVEALQAQQQAIALNDYRGIYRSRQLLDQDDAARSVALGRIYSDLNFEQLARNQATSALIQDPGNHSAHRLLADSYIGLTNLDAARQSELLQSKMTQPLNLDPLQPQLSNANLGLLDGNGPGDLSYNEYNPLFTRNGLALQLDSAIAKENTWSNDAIIAGLYDRFAFSLGQYHTETDGFRVNDDYEQDLYNVFAQVALNEETSLQLEVNQDEVTKGDVSQRLLPSLLIDQSLRANKDTTSYRLGLNHAMTPNTRILISSKRTDIQTTLLRTTSSSSIKTQRDNDNQLDIYDIQLQYLSGKHGILGGANFNQDDIKTDMKYDFSPNPCRLPYPNCTQSSTYIEKQSRLYGYYFYQPSDQWNLITALTYVRDNSEIFSKDETYLLPKLGVQWSLSDASILRAAAFKTTSSAVATSLYQTLEPTQVAGFNQIHDDFRQTEAWNYGLSFTHHFMPTLSIGIQGDYRKGETPFNLLDLNTSDSSIMNVEFDETNASIWVNWSPYNPWSLNLEYHFSNLNSVTNIDAETYNGVSPDGVIELKTHSLPVSIHYHHPSGFIAGLTTTFYDQRGVFQGKRISDAPQDASDSFWLTDLVLSYRFPKRYGLLSLGVNNIFNRDFTFEDRNSYDSLSVETSASPSALSSERIVFGKFSITFR